MMANTKSESTQDHSVISNTNMDVAKPLFRSSGYKNSLIDNNNNTVHPELSELIWSEGCLDKWIAG